MTAADFAASYSESRALVIGIDEYAHASPLLYAVNDALAIKDVLLLDFGFKASNVFVLTNSEATKAKILDAYMSFTDESITRNDRLLVFFAGHGHTISGPRGDIGFLLPQDGDTRKIGTLIRWDDLTKNADLIPAKHILYIMDACYGGLAIQRAAKPGSSRFLKDNLRRLGRQVLTAGKADETVADSGGPLPRHSIFTGHLIEALKGSAASEDKMITANGVMAYVYDKVSRDAESKQTPHFGYLSGDGDFVFFAPLLGAIADDPAKEEDILVTVPVSNSDQSPAAVISVESLTQEYLSNSADAIKFDQFVSTVVRRTTAATIAPEFSTQQQPNQPEFVRRIEQYDAITEDLQRITALTTRWGKGDFPSILFRCLARLADPLDPAGGAAVWIGLRWYPFELLLYVGGISAISARRYDNLRELFYADIPGNAHDRPLEPLIQSVTEEMYSHYMVPMFKTLPGHERNYFPTSEYLFKRLQPRLDDILFLGKSYESLFDEFEILRALVFADINFDATGRAWAPVGRFGWKYHSRMAENPLTRLLAQAKLAQNQWPPLKAGFFSGTYARFEIVSSKFEALIKERVLL